MYFINPTEYLIDSLRLIALRFLFLVFSVLSFANQSYAHEFNSESGRLQGKVDFQIQFDSFNSSVCAQDLCAKFDNALRDASFDVSGIYFLDHKSTLQLNLAANLASETDESRDIRTQQAAFNSFKKSTAEQDVNFASHATLNYDVRLKPRHQLGLEAGVRAPFTNSFGFKTRSALGKDFSAFYDNDVDFFSPGNKDTAAVEYQGGYLKGAIGFGFGKKNHSRVDLDHEGSVTLNKPGHWLNATLVARQVSDSETKKEYASYGAEVAIRYKNGLKGYVNLSENDLGQYWRISAEDDLSEKWSISGAVGFFEADEANQEFSPEDQEYYLLQLQFRLSKQLTGLLEFNRYKKDKVSLLDDAIGLAFRYQF